jgi:hypothetical protein
MEISMPVRFRADFYQVRMPNSVGSFESLLQSVAQATHIERREDVRGPVRMQDLECPDGKWCGDMLRIRTLGLPQIADPGTPDLRPIPLEPDEGLGEATAFMYTPAYRTLMLQRNRYGVSLPALQTYFTKRAGLHGRSIDFLPILGKEALERVERMKSIREVEVEIAEVSRVKALGGGGRALTDILSASAKLGHAPKLRFSLSMSYDRKRVLDRHRIIPFLKDLLLIRTNSPGASKIVVSGRDENFERTVIDLMEDRIQYETDLDEVNNARHIPWTLRTSALLNGWDDNQEEIDSLLGEPGEDHATQD